MGIPGSWSDCTALVQGIISDRKTDSYPTIDTLLAYTRYVEDDVRSRLMIAKQSPIAPAVDEIESSDQDLTKTAKLLAR